MIKLNDYLYDGDTVLNILMKYSADLRREVRITHNPIDAAHVNFLLQLIELLEHNDFLTSQSQRIREFYQYMVKEYPELAFIFKGRIKSLIRAEEKFNGYVVAHIYDYYQTNGTFPPIPELKERLNMFRDLIAYRIVVSLPRYYVKPGEDREEKEIGYLYDIANRLPDFLEDRGFSPQLADWKADRNSPLLDDAVRPYYRDYIANPAQGGYRSLHITFYDNSARCYVEVQLRTKAMDDVAEIGASSHGLYQEAQEKDRARRDLIPEGVNVYFDEAYERGMALQNLDLTGIDVNMFAAASNSLINDCCGLFRGRLILPYEHLSKYQNDLIG